MTVVQELRRSLEEPWFSDCWSDATNRVYFEAAARHGLDVNNETWPDIYSYAIEAAEALGLGEEPEVSCPECGRPMMRYAGDYGSGWTCVNCNAAGDPELDHPDAPEDPDPCSCDESR